MTPHALVVQISGTDTTCVVVSQGNSCRPELTSVTQPTGEGGGIGTSGRAASGALPAAPASRRGGSLPLPPPATAPPLFVPPEATMDPPVLGEPPEERAPASPAAAGSGSLRRSDESDEPHAGASEAAIAPARSTERCGI